MLQNQKHEKNAVIATEGGTATRGMQVLDEVDALQTEHGKLSQQLQSYAKEKEVLEVWGNFEPTGIQKLKDAGYIIGFYSCSEGNYTLCHVLKRFMIRPNRQSKGMKRNSLHFPRRIFLL